MGLEILQIKEKFLKFICFGCKEFVGILECICFECWVPKYEQDHKFWYLFG
jgi:hypothetical protein